MTFRSNAFIPAACGFLLAAAALPVALAQPAATTGRLVTRDELRACMDSDQEIRARKAALDQRNKRAAEDLAAMRKEAEEIADEKKRLEDHPDMPRTRFERRLRAYNAKLPAEQATAETFKTDLDAFNTALEAHNARCGHISATTEDRDAVMKEREAAAKSK